MTSVHSWLLEIGPLAWVTLSLWCKLVYFSVSLRSVWWAPKESIGTWVGTHPEILTGTVATVLLLSAVAVLLPRILRFVFLLLLNIFVTTLVLANMLHVHHYGDVISVVNLSHASQLRWVVPSIVTLLQPMHALYYVDILFGVLLFPLFVRACQRVPCVERRHLVRVFVAMLVCGVVFTVPTVRLAWHEESGKSAYVNLQRDVCAVMGLLPYHFVDAVVYLRGKKGLSEKVVIRNQEVDRIRAFLDAKRNKMRRSSNLFGIGRGRNMIVVSAESLQQFPIGLEIHGQPVTQRLSEFARESLYFVNFYDQTYLGTTSDGEFTAFQSLHPLPVGVIAGKYHRNQYRGLPAVLSEHGYKTLSAVGETGTFWNMNKMHPGLGFQQSFFEENYTIVERVGPWLADREFFAQSTAMLAAQRQPFMAYLLSSSNHHPFALPEKYRVLNLGELEGTLLGDYLHSVHYFDQAFGEFLDGLRRADLLDNTLVVLYGDHQAFLGELPELGRLLGFAERSEYHQLLVRKKVPFMIRLPRGESAGVRDVTGGHLDIAPTLLSLLGIEDPHSVMLGEDLTRMENALVVFRDGSFTDGNHVLINRFGPLSRSTCYEHGTGRIIDCGLLTERRREALERLRISDLIIRGDLIPDIISNRITARSR